MRFVLNAMLSILVIMVLLSSSALCGVAAQGGGYNATPALWVKAILQIADSPVTLVWKEVGADTTPSGDRVVSGYFYADPKDFAYGSIYNPEVFVKIYIATSGWCNIAYNHVTVDDVTVYSAHNYTGSIDQSGTISLNNRLAEHQYDGVSLWSCQADDEANGIYHVCNYFPLSPNNQWNYTTGDRFIADDWRTSSAGYTGILYGTTVYEFSNYVQNRENGLLFTGNKYDEGVLEDMGMAIRLIPAEMRLGETVNSSFITTTLVGVETIAVPAGTFKTLKVVISVSDPDDCSFKTTLWLAKGIGPVKIARTDANPSDCLGCMFVCDNDNDVDKINTPAELTSAVIDGTVY